MGALNRVKSQLGLKSLHSVLVVHCAHAYAAVLEGEAGWKVVFSGDTRPCDQLVAAALNATLLIHEVCSAALFGSFIVAARIVTPKTFIHMGSSRL